MSIRGSWDRQPRPFEKQFYWPEQTKFKIVDFSSISELILIVYSWKGREKPNFIIIGARRKNRKIFLDGVL